MARYTAQLLQITYQEKCPGRTSSQETAFAETARHGRGQVRLLQGQVTQRDMWEITSAAQSSSAAWQDYILELGPPSAASDL